MLGRCAGNRISNRNRVGYACLHDAVDDQSRLAYSEILTDQRKETAAGFRDRARDYFTSLGIEVSALMTDNGSVA